MRNGYKRLILEWLTRVGTFNNNREEEKKGNEKRSRKKNV